MKLTCDSCMSKNNCPHEESFRILENIEIAFNNVLDICSVAVMEEDSFIVCKNYEKQWGFNTRC